MARRAITFIWDDSEGGNVQHLAEHGVLPDEAAHVVEHAGDDDRGVSRTSGLPVAFGFTSAGRHLMVVYEPIAPDTLYVHTAYDVPRRLRRR